MNNNMQQNEAQQKAIAHGAGPMLVLAGPGSGKTFTITGRIQHLIEVHHIRPEEILVITFTKAAAAEMQERFHKKTKGQPYPVTFGTFHAIFFQILRHAHHFNASSIIRESEKHQYLDEIISTLPKVFADRQTQAVSIAAPNLTAQLSLQEPVERQELIGNLLSEFSQVKNSGQTPRTFQSILCDQEEFCYLFEQYRQCMRTHHKVDFDDMVLLCLELLQQRQDILSMWQEHFTYLLIDEFQDINRLQYEVVKLLAAPRNNLFIVGDDDQAIYGFRGSNPDIMLHFKEDYPQAQQILLNQNYRSRQEIVDRALQLISHNEHRFPKKIEAQSRDPQAVCQYAYESGQEQAQQIVTLIKQYYAMPDTQYRDIAILYRTHTHASLMAHKLTQEGIPFYSREKLSNLYQGMIAQDIRAYIRFALHPNDVKTFYRIMNRPVRYIRRDSVPTHAFTMQELLQANQGRTYVIQAIEQLYQQLGFLRQMSPFAAINFIRKGIGYEAYLQKNSQQNRQSAELLTRQLEELEQLHQEAKNFETLEIWLSYAEDRALADERPEPREQQDAVQLVTMHASKGLEWPVVVVPDLNEGIVPHKKAITRAQVEEERRLLYVAMTRAKEKLFLCSIAQNGGAPQPSRFLGEIRTKH